MKNYTSIQLLTDIGLGFLVYLILFAVLVLLATILKLDKSEVLLPAFLIGWIGGSVFNTILNIKWRR